MSRGPVVNLKLLPKFLDLSRVPYVSYGVKYIDLVSLADNAGPVVNLKLLSTLLVLGRVPYVSDGVKYMT